MHLTREEKKRKTKKAILAAAIELFGRYGFEQTSIEQLAKAAGVGKGTVYSYFATKREILQAFYEDELEYVHEQLASKTDQDATILEQMMAIYWAEFQYITRNPEFGRLFLQEMIFPHTLLPLEHQRNTSGYFELLFPIITRAQERGELRTELEPLHVCGHFFSIFLLLNHAYYSKMITYDEAEDALRTMFNQVLTGLQPIPTNNPSAKRTEP